MSPGLTFPCEFPLKIVGKNEADFTDFVIELVSRHVTGLDAEAFSVRHSGAGKYLAVSITFTAESRTQVDALYQELSEHKRVLFAL